MLHVLHYILQLLGFHEHLPLGRQTEAITVPVLQGFLEPTKFFEDYVIPGRPVVFKGAAKEFPAFQRWTDEYFLSFKERFDSFLTVWLDFKKVSWLFSYRLLSYGVAPILLNHYFRSHWAIKMLSTDDYLVSLFQQGVDGSIRTWEERNTWRRPGAYFLRRLY
jgi:hypothetical protein